MLFSVATFRAASDCCSLPLPSCVLQLLNVFSPHINPSCHCVTRRCFRLCCARRCARSQRELNMMYLGPEFDLSTRYSAVLNTITATLLYSTGIPVLLAIAVLQFFVTFWVDKFLFVRFYRYGLPCKVSLFRQSAALLEHSTPQVLSTHRTPVYCHQSYLRRAVNAGHPLVTTRRSPQPCWN